MAQYTNSTHISEEWRLDHNSIPYRESLIVVFILLYGLKVQSQRNNRQRNLRIIQRFGGRIIQLLKVLMNWCAYFQDYDETSTEKKILNARVAPYENEVLVKVEKKKTEKHPWDIANKIIKEWEQAALAVKWAIIPIELLMDKHFLNVLHSIEEITDTTPWGTQLDNYLNSFMVSFRRTNKWRESLLRWPINWFLTLQRHITIRSYVRYASSLRAYNKDSELPW